MLDLVLLLHCSASKRRIRFDSWGGSIVEDFLEVVINFALRLASLAGIMLSCSATS